MEKIEDVKQANGRKFQLLRRIPDALNDGGGEKTLLYVGGKPERLQMVDIFADNGFAIDVLEIWRVNVENLKKWNGDAKIFRTIYQGNIRNTAELPKEKYGIVMFWQGPEHVSREDLPFVLRNMESLATRLVILASPWGRYAQDAIGGNPFEKHVSHYYETDFAGFGYQTDAIGTKDKKGSNLLAWKRIG